MAQLWIVLGLAAVMFVSTNVDDLVVLLALFADPRLRPSQVVAGQVAGIAALFAGSVAGAWLAVAVAPEHVGLLGLAPLALGVRGLVRLRRPAGDDAPPPRRAGGWLAGALAVSLVTVSNGGDNLGVYTPVFATLAPWELAVVAAVFLALTAAWLGAGLALVRHPRLGPPIRGAARPFVPVVLVGLGLYVLASSGALAVLLPALR